MNKKTIMIMGGGLIGFLVLLLLVLWLLTLFKTKYYTYEEVEEKIVESCEKYYKSYPELLPTTDGKSTLSYTSLVNSNLIKPLNELLEDGDSCSVEIIVNKNGNNYGYIPKLSCGQKYTTTELYKQVLKDNSVVTENAGLYQAQDGSYYFRGKVKNNFVVFGNTESKGKESPILWQIVSIGKDNTIKLRNVTETKLKTKWDDRYNSTVSSYIGYNDFELSLIKEYLKELETNDEFLKSKDIAKLDAKELCIGPRSETETSKDGSAECSVLSKDKFVFSTLLPYEYMRASLDDNCTTADNNACTNLNYLSDVTTETEWSITPYNGNDYQAYTFDGYTYEATDAKSKNYLYVVVNLNEFAFYKSGTGTETDPYIIR